MDYTLLNSIALPIFRWWCHFDDDVYVNTELLTDLLRQYTWNEDVYLGKPSVKYKREV